MQVLERAVVLYFIPFFLQAKFTSQLLLKHCLFVFLFYILNGQCINNEPIDYKNILQSHLEPMYKPTTNQYQTVLNFPQPSTVFIFVLSTTKKTNMNFLNLTANKIISCRDLAPIPLTPIIIQTVEELAGQDKSKGFNMREHNGAVLYDTRWIASVHYTDQVTKQRQLQSKMNQSKQTNIRKDTTKTNQSRIVSKVSTTNKILDHGA